MRHSSLPSRVLILAFLVACPASADCGCDDDSRHASDGDIALLIGIGTALAAAAMTAPLWMEGGQPYVEAGASRVLGGRARPAEEYPALEDRQAVLGHGGQLAAGMSRLPPMGEGGLGVRGEVAAWRNQFVLRNPHPEPGPQDFTATTLALGAHVDGQVPGIPVVLSLGGRLGGAYLESGRADAFAWDLEAVAGVGVRLNPHLTLTGDVRGVLLLPGSNDFTSGRSQAVIADVGLRYTF